MAKVEINTEKGLRKKEIKKLGKILAGSAEADSYINENEDYIVLVAGDKATPEARTEVPEKALEKAYSALVDAEYVPECAEGIVEALKVAASCEPTKKKAKKVVKKLTELFVTVIDY